METKDPFRKHLKLLIPQQDVKWEQLKRMLTNNNNSDILEN